ncbi:MAG: class I SAM-dependent methyltransferase [Candidatus Dadabacteria bacterium]|nr:MAG: class I SAM-dependent methyltransferase [Candidatus Dadabacteria bacterium]
MPKDIECKICGGTDLTPCLDLGMQPWGNNFLRENEIGSEPLYPLRLIYCNTCSCVQLDYTVPKEVMFSDHTYVSGTTETLRRHFEETAKKADAALPESAEPRSVLDIGSNDGTQLNEYRKLGYSCLGVESCKKVADIAIENGIETIVEFFNLETAKKIGRKFDIINASGIFFHLEELHSASEGIKEALKDDGIFVVQFLYMKNIVENLAFDQIYHEHLLYYTLKTLRHLLNLHGMEPFDCYLSPIHGGSAIVYACHKGTRPVSDNFTRLLQDEETAGANSLKWYKDFAIRVAQMKEDTVAYLKKKKAEGKTIYGFGAPVKGNTFLNYCKIGTQYLECLVEKNPLRKGLYSPGMHIPIILEEELRAHPDVYLVLAWNFKEEILRNNRHLVEKGVEFYFPVNPKGV